jgi:hypothetical protein
MHSLGLGAAADAPSGKVDIDFILRTADCKRYVEVAKSASPRTHEPVWLVYLHLSLPTPGFPERLPRSHK